MKNQLKESIFKKRNSLSKEELIEKSRQIRYNLFNLKEYNNSKIIMFFVSFNNEVNTHEMLMESLRNKIVVIPKVFSHGIEPSIITDFDNLITGKFGILEPVEILKIAYKNIELILVPGIVFDKEGHRIGHGFGYYDKFLAKVPKAIKIGLAFDFQIVDNIPREMHDVPVDMIVTDLRVIECKK